MRRSLSGLLIVLFWLGPFAALLQASPETRLPACCRRHGAHHCVMSEQMASTLAQTANGATHLLAAPARCPSFPRCMAGVPAPAHALAAPPVTLPVLLATCHSPAFSRASARMNQLRSTADRGPPRSTLG